MKLLVTMETQLDVATLPYYFVKRSSNQEVIENNGYTYMTHAHHFLTSIVGMFSV